jgi:hypothetical protein
MGLQIDVSTEDIKTLQENLQNLKDGGLVDYYEQQIYQWIQDNMEALISASIKQVYFGLTDDGHFCAFVPNSWSDVSFDTGANYGTTSYGRLILRFSADGSTVIDNTDAGFPSTEELLDLATSVDKLNTTVFTGLQSTE